MWLLYLLSPLDLIPEAVFGIVSHHQLFHLLRICLRSWLVLSAGHKFFLGRPPGWPCAISAHFHVPHLLLQVNSTFLKIVASTNVFLTFLLLHQFYEQANHGQYGREPSCRNQPVNNTLPARSKIIDISRHFLHIFVITVRNQPVTNMSERSENTNISQYFPLHERPWHHKWSLGESSWSRSQVNICPTMSDCCQ